MRTANPALNARTFGRVGTIAGRSTLVTNST